MFPAPDSLPRPEYALSDTIERLNAALEGRYHVERELGEGGMATVYLADDLKHERRVALKVLKPELAAVVGAERFLAEIKTTANLQHPHVLPLFDSGEADSFLFYVMPYLDGETLRERIDRDKQLPIDEAIRIATAVAAALQHAHDRGVIHRDIKPANILLQDGQPVVADFGIAIAVGAAGGSRMTETGLSVGTPFYMSPEQATGDQQVGPASDTYSLAALLYEMLTGDPPYIGSTAQAVLGKIIQGAPVSATAIRTSIPPNVDAAIRRALEKLPADRFTGAQDFARALADKSYRYGGDDVSAGPRRGGNRLAVGLGVLAAVFALVAAWSLSRPEAPVPVRRFSLSVTEAQFPSEWMSLSADGSAMVMTYFDDRNQQRLWLRRWSELSSAEVQGADGNVVDPVISPDGTEVAFTEGGELKVSPLAGGIVRTLSTDASCCVRWGSDGFIYFAGAGNNIERVPWGGGEIETVTTRRPEDDNEHGYFQIMPDGDTGVFSVFTTPPRLESFRISTGERKTITTGMRSYVTSTGHIVFATLEGQILAAPFDSKKMEVTGPVVPLVQGVGVTASEDVMYTLSENGTLLYWSATSNSVGNEMIWVSRSGEVTTVDPDFTFSPSGAPRSMRLSPDGTRVAFQDNSEGGGDIWVKELDRGPVSRLTFDGGADWAPAWSADGQSVLFLSNRQGPGRDVWSQRADGTGEPVMVLDTEGVPITLTTTLDGAWLIFRTSADPSTDIFAQRPGDETATSVAASPDVEEYGPALSPDGRWIAYSSDETGEAQVYVRPFPDVQAGRWQVSSEIAGAPVWSHSGRELFYSSSDGLMVAQIETSPSFRVTRREKLFNFPAGVVPNLTRGWYDVALDDQRFLMSRSAQFGNDATASQPELILVQNFFEELKARVPN
jgi:eukaryotic-like serine/threonine-protein kinase